MFGRRPDGRRVKNMDPIVQLTPYFMPMRCDAQVFLDYNVEYEPLMRYIAKKSLEGVKITFMEIFVAAYVRSISQVPEVNRFVMNKQLFNRTEITAAFTMLMDTEDGSFEETAVKIFFDPSDTIYDVSARIKQAVEANRKPEDPGPAVVIARLLMKIPLLPNAVVGLVRLLDRYGLCPKVLLDILPFHTGMYITNMASIGMRKVYHHIYNFGNTGLFFSIGAPDRSYSTDGDGKVTRKSVLPVGITADERVCSGAVYSVLFACYKKLLSHPELLETPPESIKFNEGCEYSCPKPERVFCPKPQEPDDLMGAEPAKA